MKGYGWLICAVAVLLLLLPLPSLNRSPAAQTPTPSLPSDTAPTTQPTESPTDETDDAVFRVLCGEEVVTLTEAGAR